MCHLEGTRQHAWKAPGITVRPRSTGPRSSDRSCVPGADHAFSQALYPALPAQPDEEGRDQCASTVASGGVFRVACSKKQTNGTGIVTCTP